MARKRSGKGIGPATARASRSAVLLAERGRDQMYIYRELRRRPEYRTLRNEQIMAATNLGIEASRAGDVFDPTRPNRYAGESIIPCNPTIAKQYRYVVLLEFGTPGERGNEMRVYVHDTDVRLTNQDLVNLAPIFANKLNEDKYPFGVGQMPVDLATTNEVISIERNC